MADINDLVQEFWRTSSDGAVGAPFYEMRRLLEILQRCIEFLDVSFNIVLVLRLQLIKIYSLVTGSIPLYRTFKSTAESEQNLRDGLMGI